MLPTLREYMEYQRPRFLRRPFWRLAAHFAARVFENSADDSGEDELDLGVGSLLALLAVPGAFITILLFDKYSSLIRFFRGGPPFDPYAASLPDQYFFIVFSMAITGVVTVIKWESIFPDRRDYMNLAPLPVTTRSIFLANLIAVLAMAVLFAVDVNAVSSVLFPVIVNMENGTFHQFLQFAAVHGLSVMLASLFVFFGMFALIGLLMAVLPRSIFRRVSLYVRVAVIIYMLALLATGSAVPRFLGGKIPPPGWVQSLPPVWFLGLSRSLTGRSGPEFLPFAALALRALGGVSVAALALYAVSYRRHFALIPEAVERGRRESLRAEWLSLRGLKRLFLRSPFQRAFYPFILKTLVRSEKHSLFFGAFLGLGLVMTSQRIVSGVNQIAGSGGTVPSADLLSAPLLLFYCVIFGLRFAFEVPADLRANWIHRMLVDCDKHESSAVARSVILSVVLPVVLFACVPVYAYVWGWRVAGIHALIMGLACWFLTELLLVKFRKIPFTCSYPHWSEYTIVNILLSVLGLVLFSSVPAQLELWMLGWTPGLLFLLPMIFVARKMLARLREQNAYRSRLVFEDQPIPALELLNLSGN
ncbi:MAG: hypothetical protein LAP21_17315 [Acidobacteriia bacterium]|nr:hypothetical protein [Terriglobia bacterium]